MDMEQHTWKMKTDAIKNHLKEKPGNSFDRFEKLVKKVINVPKKEIDASPSVIPSRRCQFPLGSHRFV
jgi:hypothetical protein